MCIHFSSSDSFLSLPRVEVNMSFLMGPPPLSITLAVCSREQILSMKDSSRQDIIGKCRMIGF